MQIGSPYSTPVARTELSESIRPVCCIRRTARFSQ